MTKKTSCGCCELCLRRTELTFHHLIPRKLHRRNYFRKHYTRDELQSGICICRACHRALHKFYDEMTLGKRLNTIDRLRNDDAVSRHVKWVARQK